MGRIDALELITVLGFLVEGTYQEFVELIFNHFAFNGEGVIYMDEFFYYFDCFFRGLTKITYNENQKINSENSKYGKSIRLYAKNLEEFCNSIFLKKAFLHKEEFILNMTEKKSIVIENLIMFKQRISINYKINSNI